MATKSRHIEEKESRPSYWDVWRRLGWLLDNTNIVMALNIAFAGLHYGLKRENLLSWPVFLKIDLSPLCNLHCTVCVHAKAEGRPALVSQEFKAEQKMRVDQYRKIIDEVKGHTSALSLYYLGDPLVHQDIEDICSIGRNAGLNVHISTNFSFRLSEERIRRLLTSGITHFTVCVDGLSQLAYEQTRRGGRVDWVLSNLSRMCKMRRDLNLKYPRIEIQYIKFEHNVGELSRAIEFFRSIGVDQITDFWGSLHNYTDVAVNAYKVFGPKPNRFRPRCEWPYFGMVIRYDGGVVPCCNHRLTAQYQKKGDRRIIGNVFDKGVFEVWNSMAYQAIRHLCSDPCRVRQEPTLERSFCYGCNRLFETDRANRLRLGKTEGGCR